MTSLTEADSRGIAGGRVPDFFIVGHPKSGTTAMYEMLREHPGIYMPELKEPSFLASELPRQAHRTVLPSTFEQYLWLFGQALPEQRIGEASATYLWSSTAARNIAEIQPGARSIAILREPASFLRSLHLQNLQSGYETEKDLRAALSLEDARRKGRYVPRDCGRPQALLYSEYPRYVEQLRRYHAVFAKEQVLVLVYDDFRLDNEQTMRAVHRFLGVDDSLPVEPTEANPTVLMRSRRLDDLMHAISLGGGPLSQATKASITSLTPQRLRRTALRAARRRFVHAPAPPPDMELMRELRHRFKPEVLALSEYLDRDLVGLWGYDAIG